jgi:hypothetical protein
MPSFSFIEADLAKRQLLIGVLGVVLKAFSLLVTYSPYFLALLGFVSFFLAPLGFRHFYYYSRSMFTYLIFVV